MQRVCSQKKKTVIFLANSDRDIFNFQGNIRQIETVEVSSALETRHPLYQILSVSAIVTTELDPLGCGWLVKLDCT